MEIESTPGLLALRRAGVAAQFGCPNDYVERRRVYCGGWTAFHILRCFTETERTIPLLPARGLIGSPGAPESV
jgi:hypothetical protein